MTVIALSACTATAPYTASGAQRPRESVGLSAADVRSAWNPLTPPPDQVDAFDGAAPLEVALAAWRPAFENGDECDHLETGLPLSSRDPATVTGNALLLQATTAPTSLATNQMNASARIFPSAEAARAWMTGVQKSARSCESLKVTAAAGGIRFSSPSGSSTVGSISRAQNVVIAFEARSSTADRASQTRLLHAIDAFAARLDKRKPHTIPSPSPSSTSTAGCAEGQVPLGSTSTSADDGGIQVVGGRCFDLAVSWGGSGLFSVTEDGVRRAADFCASLGLEPELAKLLGHGTLVANPLSSLFPYGQGCLYEMKAARLSQVPDAKGTGQPGIEGVVINWYADPDPNTVVWARVLSGGGPFLPQPGIGRFAYSDQSAPAGGIIDAVDGSGVVVSFRLAFSTSLRARAIAALWNQRVSIVNTALARADQAYQKERHAVTTPTATATFDGSGLTGAQAELVTEQCPSLLSDTDVLYDLGAVTPELAPDLIKAAEAGNCDDAYSDAVAAYAARGY